MDAGAWQARAEAHPLAQIVRRTQRVLLTIFPVSERPPQLRYFVNWATTLTKKYIHFRKIWVSRRLILAIKHDRVPPSAPGINLLSVYEMSRERIACRGRAASRQGRAAPRMRCGVEARWRGFREITPLDLKGNCGSRLSKPLPFAFLVAAFACGLVADPNSGQSLRRAATIPMRGRPFEGSIT
jgi:hypothetical protein